MTDTAHINDPKLRAEFRIATSHLCVAAQVLDACLDAEGGRLDDCGIHRGAIARFRAAVARFEAAQSAYILDGLESAKRDLGV